MEEYHITVPHRSRYYTFGTLSGHTRNIWFVLHGYGQLAKYFIRKFEGLNPEENFVVAPEGPNKFYLQGFSGKVGATWMTKEDRETDISNYVTFLNELYFYIIGNKELNDVRINILGFSQGVATASRWITDGQVKADNLLLWAGILPPDLVVEKARHELANKKVLLILGNKDPYINEDRLKEMKNITKTLELEPEELWYDGDHQIDPEVLLKIATSY